MNEETEKRFIETFIVKNKKDRLLFELSGKKRRCGIGRFSHEAQNLIKPERILCCGTDLYLDKITDIAKKHGVQGLCCIIAYDQDIDKKCCGLSEALGLVLGNGMPAIIICDKLVIIETEQCFGTPMRYILF